MAERRQAEGWSTKIGVILAVAASAVGLGNFLRFPGRAALYGGGAFIIPYFISLLVLGIPICWVEWTLGRYGGRHGFNSAPGVFRVVWRSGTSSAFGALAVFVPVVIYMYYVFIEAWCLAYAWFYLTGALAPGADPAGYQAYFSAFFNDFIGVSADGALFHGLSPALVALVICFALNFWLVYRGLSGGIEKFCQWALPALVVAALIVLARVLTLGTPNPDLPEQNVINGLGFMWNPKPIEPGGGTFSALLDSRVWLEAAGQIFFTLSVGFGIIITYASYLKPSDDVTLSALTASAANEFCEVCLGGLITIPAAFIFSARRRSPPWPGRRSASASTPCRSRFSICRWGVLRLPLVQPALPRRDHQLDLHAAAGDRVPRGRVRPRPPHRDDGTGDVDRAR
jgi:SNF family Na+-dependent transporter